MFKNEMQTTNAIINEKTAWMIYKSHKQGFLFKRQYRNSIIRAVMRTDSGSGA
jgi:hypothetical protein